MLKCYNSSKRNMRCMFSFSRAPSEAFSTNDKEFLHVAIIFIEHALFREEIMRLLPDSLSGKLSPTSEVLLFTNPCKNN